MAHQIVCRIKDKSWTAGVDDIKKANYHVGMKRLELDLSWKESKQPRFLPYIDDQGHQAMKVIIE